MRQLIALLALFTLAACEGALLGEPPRIVTAAPDARVPGGDAGMALAPDAAVATEPDAWIATMGAPDAWSTPRGALAPDVQITRVDLFQTVRVPLARAGAGADREGLPVVLGREALVRVHVAGDGAARELTAAIELESDAGVQRFVDTRVPSLPSTDADPASLFEIHVPASAIVLGARFRVRLEVADGVADAPDATYPTDGSFDDLEVEDLGRPVVVLVPFRFDTDGSGRLPEVGDEQLARVRDELTSRFPYADVEVRVHDVVSWSRANRLGGNVDWGAVNARLITMRDEEGAPEAEYWYGLVAPDSSRSSYCDRVIGSCVTGQAYVATLHGSRVGSGVGFDDVASVRTLGHELGHEHGRSHSPCGTSSSDDGFPYSSGRIGVWGWDRRDGTFHDPDVATDMMGYCSHQWISDYTYRRIYERQIAMRAATWSRVGAPVARRFVTIEDGVTSWSEPSALRSLPGERTSGTFVGRRGEAIATIDVARLTFADSDGRTWIVPATAPRGARALVVDGERIALE